MEYDTHEPNPLLTTSENPLDVVTDFDSGDEEPKGNLTTRHDGWTGQRMAMFCAMLAETGIVTDACIAVGMSTTGAYSARRRNPLFAAAWEQSLKLARDRLADALLERSLNGCLEKYYKDGELVGEKRILDNKLGMAILRRLDRKAETGLALHSSRSPVRELVREDTPDWDLMLSALRTGDEEMMAEAMVELGKAEGRVHEVGEVADPPNRPPADANFDDEFEPDPRCWWDEDDSLWMTDFPPPPGFSGYQKGRWGDEEYCRECTAEESAALAAARDAELDEDRSADEAERDAWFASLKNGAGGEQDRHPGLEPGSAFTSAAEEQSRNPPPDHAR